MRILFWLVALLFTAALIWRIGGHLTGTVGAGAGSIILTFVIALLVIACINGAILIGRFSAHVDQARNVLVVRAYRTRELPLDRPTTVRIRLHQMVGAQGQRTSALWQAEFKREGHTENVNEPYEKDFRGFVESLQNALRVNPELPVDEETRRIIEDPGLLAERRESAT